MTASADTPPVPPAPGTLMLFSNTVPIDRSGSFVIFRRHFLPLVEAGWRLKIFSYFPAPAAGVFWEHIRLPHRLAWWPPASARSLVSQRLRSLLMLRHLRRSGALDAPGPRVLLANLWDSQALFAAALAHEGCARLGVFLHDDEITWNECETPARYLRWCRREVSEAASRLWAVSARLGAQFPEPIRSRCRVLRPIPAEGARAEWRPDFARGAHLGYAGKVYPGLAPLLTRLAALLEAEGGSLTIITDESTASRPPVTAANLAWRPYFERADQSAAWLRENCSALLIAHPLADDMPADRWRMLRESFPSKLPEYAQLGLPLVLAGTRDSEFGDWAAAHPAMPFFGDAGAKLAAHLSGLRTESAWRAAASATLQLAETEFAPVRLQAGFVADLESLITETP